MGRSTGVLVALATLFFSQHAVADDIYNSWSPVLQVTGSTYDNLIAKSNYTSIVEFYAPWCGHCKNLKPAYEKVARSLNGLAKVAAIDCDDDSNKPFCGSMGVKGFPTLKIVKPGKKVGKPIVTDYDGPREAKYMIDAVTDKIPNHVKRLKDSDFQKWLDGGTAPKALLFSDKGLTSSLLKSIAIDFLDAMDVAQIRNTEEEIIKRYGIDTFPTLLMIPGDGQDAVKYDGELKKEAMVAFLAQAAAPNPDGVPRPKKEKSTSNSKPKAKPNNHAKDAEEAGLKPIKMLEPIPKLSALADLQKQCFNTKAGTCILALVSDETIESVAEVLISLSLLRYRYESANRKLFPFFQLDSADKDFDDLRAKLKFPATDAGVHLVATNGKRAWYRHWEPELAAPLSDDAGQVQMTDSPQASIEAWIDNIRMGDGTKTTIPKGLIVLAADVGKDSKAEPVKEQEQQQEQAKVDTNDPVAMREALKAALPEGVEFELEEVDDVEVEMLMAKARKDAAEHEEAKKAEKTTEEPTKEKVDHIIDEL